MTGKQQTKQGKQRFDARLVYSEHDIEEAIRKHEE